MIHWTKKKNYQRSLYSNLMQNFLQEILTMKGGAVQHSPPDKSLPEPGPWSPV